MQSSLLLAYIGESPWVKESIIHAGDGSIHFLQLMKSVLILIMKILESFILARGDDQNDSVSSM